MPLRTVKDVDLEKEVKRHPETLSVIEIRRKPIYWVGLPDWDLCYIEYDTKEEMEDLRLILAKLYQEEGVGSVQQITDKRIYFEL